MADLINDRVLPFHEENDLPVLRILTDRGAEYCGRVDKHDFQLFLAINNIDHTKTKVKSPQTNGISIGVAIAFDASVNCRNMPADLHSNLAQGSLHSTYLQLRAVHAGLALYAPSFILIAIQQDRENFATQFRMCHT